MQIYYIQHPSFYTSLMYVRTLLFATLKRQKSSIKVSFQSPLEYQLIGFGVWLGDSILQETVQSTKHQTNKLNLTRGKKAGCAPAKSTHDKRLNNGKAGSIGQEREALVKSGK